MNERFKELADESGMTQYVAANNKFLERFAELIVQECVHLIAIRKDEAIDKGWNVDESMTMVELDLEEHFGVTQ